MGRGISAIAGVLAIVLAQGATAQTYHPDEARPEPIDAYGDWILACATDGFCEALGLPLERDGEGAFVVVYRAPSVPGAFASIYVPVGAGDLTPGEGFALDVQVSGRAGEVYSGTWNAEAPPIDGRFGPLDPTGYFRAVPGADGHMAFIEAVRSGDAIAIRGRGVSDRLSLSGSAAALRRMDARQELAGTTAALVEPGDGAPPGPRTLGPAISLRALTLTAIDPPPTPPADLPPPPEDGDCDGVAPLAWKLGDGRTLWGVCELRANTNLLYRFWLALPGYPIDVAFVRRGTPGEDPQVLANPVLEDDGLVIRAMELGRGLGDCGEIARWLWDAVRGPMLVHFAEMPDCRGVPPQAWPVLVDINYQPDAAEGGEF